MDNEKKSFVDFLEQAIEGNIIKTGEGIIIDSGNCYIEIPIVIIHGKITPAVAERLNEAIKSPLKIVASTTGMMINKVLIVNPQSLTITP